MLFHFSEDASITQFHPHVIAGRMENKPLVWAIDEEHAPHYYFPRDCPRVIFFPGESSTQKDIERFFSHTDARKIIAIESDWLQRVQQTTLYRYTLPPETFECQDASAGYWISRQTVEPLKVELIGDLIQALAQNGIELRITPSLWPLRNAVVNSTLEFSFIRMRNAQPE